MNRIKSFLVFMLNLRAFLKIEFGKGQSLGVVYFFKNIGNGFLSISSRFYDFPSNDKSQYLSDWARLHRASKINDRKRIVMDDKLVFHHMHRDNKFVKPIVALTKGNKIYKSLNNQSIEIANKKQFEEFVRQFSHGLIIKPYTGGGGSRISKVVCINDKLHFEGACKNYDDFEKLVLRNDADFLMTEIIKQTGLIHDVYPNTLNTIRILTMFDPHTNKSFIARAVQRMGTKTSVVVDNFTAGGISANINIETGEIGQGAHYPEGEELVWYKSHPDTGKTFNGLKIRNWEEIVEYILDISQQYFYIPYIGWDIVPMEEGFLILEANSNSDVNLLQIHGGLLKDIKVREFYKHYKVIH